MCPTLRQFLRSFLNAKSYALNDPQCSFIFIVPGVVSSEYVFYVSDRTCAVEDENLRDTHIKSECLSDSMEQNLSREANSRSAT
jgi:hypothetical protein